MHQLHQISYENVLLNGFSAFFVIRGKKLHANKLMKLTPAGSALPNLFFTVSSTT